MRICIYELYLWVVYWTNHRPNTALNMCTCVLPTCRGCGFKLRPIVFHRQQRHRVWPMASRSKRMLVLNASTNLSCIEPQYTLYTTGPFRWDRPEWRMVQNDSFIRLPALSPLDSKWWTKHPRGTFLRIFTTAWLASSHITYIECLNFVVWLASQPWTCTDRTLKRKLHVHATQQTVCLWNYKPAGFGQIPIYQDFLLKCADTVKKDQHVRN